MRPHLRERLSTKLLGSLLVLVLGCGDDSVGADAAVDARGMDAPRTDAPVDAGVDVDASDADGSDADASMHDSGASIVLPTANAMIDYQLGEAYPPPEGVTWVSRDRNAAPAPGLYNVCYVNGFQTQPDERDFWETEHPDLLLRDAGGDVVIDPDWDEIILDVTTAEKRAALAEIVGGWIAGCADDGFDAIEIDNLDTYARSDGLVSQDDAVAFMRMLSDRAHALGMAIAQKNSTDVLVRAAEMATDFAIAEECNRYDECDAYQAVYGDRVYVIEYRDQDFDRGCADFPELSIVRRDLNLVGPSSSAYRYDGC